MILNGIDIGLGKIVITDSKATIKGVDVPINRVDIYNKDHTYRFTFWTMKKFHQYNELPLNKKVDALDMIDDYDIDFNSKEHMTINSRENTEVYFTRIDENKYIVNAKINDFSECLFGNPKDLKTLDLEAVIDIEKDHI